MVNLIVLILTLLLDLYIAEKYKKKYNVFQNSIIKYKELNLQHKKKMRWTTSVSLPLIIIVASISAPLGVSKAFEYIIFCTFGYFFH